MVCGGRGRNREIVCVGGRGREVVCAGEGGGVYRDVVCGGKRGGGVTRDSKAYRELCTENKLAWKKSLL